MKILRPLWMEGAFLAPQLFQQQAQWHQLCDETLARLGVAHPWGVLKAEFDPDALRLGTLKLEQLCARLPDGTLTDSEHADPLPPARTLQGVLPESRKDAVIVLALPLVHANGDNCHRGEDEPDTPKRYRLEWRDVQDRFGSETENMATERYALSLRFAHDNNDDYITCPLARLKRDGQAGWAIDPVFVPPLLALSASPPLCTQLEMLLGQLRAKRSRLMGMRRESNQRMADFAVADVSLFWLLNALNSHEPILSHLDHFPDLHPEFVWQELARLAGALLTFSLEHDVDAIPAYQHDNLDAVLPPLMHLVSELLEASLPSRVIAIELKTLPGNQWRGELNDARLREDADFYLSVRSPLPAAQLQTRLPLLCKVGAPDDVSNIVNVALDGVPLLPLSHVPAAIPLRLENQYFAFDLNHPAAKAMLASGYCSIYVPGTLPDIQLELFAVLRS